MIDTLLTRYIYKRFQILEYHNKLFQIYKYYRRLLILYDISERFLSDLNVDLFLVTKETYAEWSQQISPLEIFKIFLVLSQTRMWKLRLHCEVRFEQIQKEVVK